MSALVLSHTTARTRSPGRMLAAFRAAEPRLFDLGALLLLSMIPTAVAASLDTRLFQGINVWDKPLKFEFALAVYLLTLVLFARFLPPGTTVRRWYRTYVTTVLVAIVAEMLWIGGAAAMAIPSHFNQTPLGGAIYGAMGFAAVLLTSLSTVFAWQIARNPATGLSPAVKESVVLGLALVLPLTLITAGTMSSMGGHWVGGARSDAGALALIGWARDGGDLRVAHFFATHAMHFVPAFGLVSAALFGAAGRGPVRAFAAIFVVLVAYTFVQALSGQPFLPALG